MKPKQEQLLIKEFLSEILKLNKEKHSDGDVFHIFIYSEIKKSSEVRKIFNRLSIEEKHIFMERAHFMAYQKKEGDDISNIKFYISNAIGDYNSNLFIKMINVYYPQYNDMIEKYLLLK